MNDDLAYAMNWRVLVYGVTAAIIILAGALAAWVTAPSPLAVCAQACGDERMHSFTAGVDKWLNDGVVMPPVPEKCECKP